MNLPHDLHRCQPDVAAPNSLESGGIKTMWPVSQDPLTQLQVAAIIGERNEVAAPAGGAVSERIWTCTIGGKVASLPKGADAPMRQAVQDAFAQLAGVDAEFTFSGWGGELTEPERAVVENRLPVEPPAHTKSDALAAALNTICKLIHSGEEIEGDDGLAMMVPIDLWNEACEAVEVLVGEDPDDAAMLAENQKKRS